jgi:cytochrome c553
MPRWAVIGRLRAAALAVLLAAAPAFMGAGQAGDAEAGKRLYWEGIGADGAPIRGVTQGDVEVTGAQFSCVSCHRPSGFGTSEGGNYMPPIIGEVLFNAKTPDRNRNFKELYQEVQPPGFWARVRQPRMRPAYDEAALARALREGVDPGGHEFDPIMPRYDLSDADVANLAAFLRTLSEEISPGVEGRDIHFATIIGPDADPDAADAMLRTMELFFDWMNKDTEGDTQNPTFSPNYRSNFISAYRYWQLHVWRLEGPPGTWRAQLEAHYAAQPVFATVSGLVAGPWDEIGAFCDARRLPCIFPNTELPTPGEGRYGYSVFFNRGLALEAEALALHLGDRDSAPARVVQLHGTGPAGTRPAQAFAAALARVLPDVTVETVTYEDAAELRAALAAAGDADVLALWPQDIDGVLAALAGAAPGASLIYLPSAAKDRALETLPPELMARTRLVWPYDKPGSYHPRKFRVRGWMHSRRLEVSHPRIQLQTYYALTMAQFSLLHMIDDFYRDYMLEIIEHQAENELNPGTHPELALGPGQRFASKGAFIAALAPDTRLGYRVVSDWIVP